MNKVLVFSVIAAGTVSGLLAFAQPPPPVVLAQGTYQPFRVDTDKHAFPIDFRATAKTPLDIVVREHHYAVDGSTGWHSHAGPAFITVLEGELTFYEYDDPSCTPTVVQAGEGYADSGHGHIGFNTGEGPARDITVLITTVDATVYRKDLIAPNPYCGF